MSWGQPWLQGKPKSQDKEANKQKDLSGILGAGSVGEWGVATEPGILSSIPPH